MRSVGRFSFSFSVFSLSLEGGRDRTATLSREDADRRLLLECEQCESVSAIIEPASYRPGTDVRYSFRMHVGISPFLVYGAHVHNVSCTMKDASAHLPQRPKDAFILLFHWAMAMPSLHLLTGCARSRV